MAKKQTGFIFEDKLKTVEVTKVRGRVIRRKPQNTIAFFNHTDKMVNNYIIYGDKLKDNLTISNIIMYQLETVLKTVISTE